MNLNKVILAASLAGFAAAASANTYTSPGGAIPDAVGTVPGSLVVTFNVTEAGSLAALDLTLTGLTHTWAGDLIITLTSPGGTVADIMRRATVSTAPTSLVGDSSDFNGTYRFIDSGGDLAAALALGTSLFVVPGGDYQASTRIAGTTANSPVLLNSVFAGTSLLGTWTLAVSDNAGADTGAFTSASLNVTAVPEASTWLMMGLGLAGLAAVRRRHTKA